MAKKSIAIGDVRVPLDAYAIGGTALLGIRGSGKTWMGKGIAEQMLEHGVPIIAFDPIGVWRYLKVPAAKGGKGYPVVVAGGKGADLPLTPQSAQEIVRAAMRENISLVVDLYDKSLSKGDWRRIVQACFQTLLYENEGVRHIFLEEAAEYVPQQIRGADGETYAAVEKLVRMGGNASLGITLINQRAQEVNKAVLDLCENLVLMRQMGAHAIDALEKWIDKVSPDFASQIAAGMPKMLAGEAWVFAGGAEKPIFTRSGKINTFHPDRKNPDVKMPTAVTDTSSFVEALQRALPALAEQQAANDPKKLKAEIARLQKLISSASNEAPKVNTAEAEQMRERCARLESDNRALEQNRDHLLDALERAHACAGRLFDHWANHVEGAREILKGMPSAILPYQPQAAPARAAAAPRPLAKSAAPPRPRTNGRATPLTDDISGPMQRILDSLAWWESIGVMQQGNTGVAFMANYSPTSTSYTNPRSALSARGLIEYPSKDVLRLTDAGRVAARYPESPGTGEELRQRVLQRLTGPQRRILEPLLAAYPNPLTNEQVAEAAAYSPTSTSYTNPRSALSGLDLIRYPAKGTLVAADVLFPGG